MTKQDLIKQGWALIGAPSNYKVTTDGKVYSCAKGEWVELKGDLNSLGYRRVRINGKREFVHRLVATCFLDNTDGHQVVNHKNLDKLDNSVGNLEWCSQKQNIGHAKSYGAFNPPKGEKHYSANKTESFIKEFKKFAANNAHLNYAEIGRVFDITRQEARQIIIGKLWNHVV